MHLYLHNTFKPLNATSFMENKNVGYLILGISVLIIFIIFIFNNAIEEFGEKSCPLVQAEDFCPTHSAINQQTYLSLAIVGILIAISLFLIFSKPNDRIIVRKVKEKLVKKEMNTEELNKEEKQVLSLVKENKAVFQSDIIEKLAMNKAKVTRILDRLEGQGFIERKRRGMTNVVVLKI